MDRNKIIGGLIIGISAVLAYASLSLAIELGEATRDSCVCVTCPMETGIPLQAYLGVSGAVILGVLGLYLILTSRKMEKSESDRKEKFRQILNTLSGDEKEIYDLLIGFDGAMLQSEIVEETGFPKAKVSRVVGKMEGKDLVEKRRSGVTNIVLLKRY